MIEFGGENKEINTKSKTAPFLLSLTDTPDNVLRIVIAFPMEGEEGADLENFPEPYKTRVADMLAHSRPVYKDPDQSRVPVRCVGIKFHIPKMIITKMFSLILMMTRQS